jgi:predicted RNA binding protein YcfA (HicA-like mRNA interferase family)
VSALRTNEISHSITQHQKNSITIRRIQKRPKEMSQFEKLMQKLNSGKSLTFSETQLILKKLGFTLARVSGSHHIYTHPLLDRPVNMQPVGKDAKPYQLKQIRDIISELGLDKKN